MFFKRKYCMFACNLSSVAILCGQNPETLTQFVSFGEMLQFSKGPAFCTFIQIIYVLLFFCRFLYVPYYMVRFDKAFSQVIHGQKEITLFAVYQSRN